MPIYEYACGSCEHRFETIQRASEERLRDCPECGEAALKKLLSAPVFRLKGSGWYETDFKTSDKRNVSDGGDGAQQEAASQDAKTESNDKPNQNGGDAGDAKRSSSSSESGAKAKSDTTTQTAAPAKVPAKAKN